MATYLLCSNPIHGHVGPLQAIGEDLLTRGHRVVMVTGTRFEAQLRAAGLGFRPLTGLADYDDRDVDAYLPDRGDKRGVALAQYDIQTIFVRPIPDQAAALQATIAEEQPDAVLVDNMFAGAVPLLLGPRESRPPILAVGVTPLAQSSRDVAPMGTGLPPSSSPLGRLRNRVLGVVAHRVLFRDTQRLARQMIAHVNGGAGRPLRASIMDASRLPDRFLQLSPQELEYPRSDLAPDTRFVGALPLRPTGVPRPAWWHDLDGGHPVVHVTQGTIDNRDLDRLIRPTLQALADRDLLVVVTMGGRDPGALGEIPANARVASYLPYDELLPKIDAFVTNGGFGGVQQALAAGVPVIVAGDTEDKPEVAARVRWAGVGIDLRTGRPCPEAVGDAVDTVLHDPSYPYRTRELATKMAGYDAFEAIAAELEAAVPAR